jgi:integrase
MGDVNFYLKKAETGATTRLIYLQFRYSGGNQGGQKFVYTFGQKVALSNWNPAKQRVKNNKTTTADGKYALNDLLDNLAELCRKSYNEELKNGIPAKRTLKKHLDDFFYQNLVAEDPSKKYTLLKLIQRFVDGEIKYKGRDKSKGSLNNYRSVLLHLEAFQKKTGYKVDFETINLDFFYSYTTYLKKEKKLAPNTIAKDITLLKLFMGEAVDLGCTTNLQFKHKKFTIEGKETDAVYLKEPEIMALYNHDFSGHKKLEAVRDLFVVGCFTGLRYSDYSNIRVENIIETDGEVFIKMITQKTGELVIIPTNPIIREIFAKYEANENRLPRALSNQKFNDYVKEACEKAELKETGRLASNPKLALHKCISSHTARRSFATNLYLEGFPTYELMKITGHRTEKAFLKYIKVSKLDSAKRLNEHIKSNWSKKMLKVAS